MGVFGTFLGGLIYDSIGPSGCYYLIGAIYAVGVVPLFMLHIAKPPDGKISAGKEPVLRSLVEGLKYVGRSRSILALNVIAGVWNLINFPARTVVIPVFARNVLNLDAATYGLLMGGMTFGSMVGSLLLAFLGDFNRKGLLCLLSAVTSGCALFSLSLLRSFHLVFVLLAIHGGMNQIMMTLISTLLLSYSSTEMRGRVMGIRMQVIVTTPFGSVIAGNLVELLGIPSTLGLFGASWVLSVLIIAMLTPKLRKLK
jgi:MFS family permease